MSKISRARVRSALKRHGVPLARDKYDGAGVHIVEFVDYWGVTAAFAVNVEYADVKAALAAARIPFEDGNYVMVPKEIHRPEEGCDRCPCGCKYWDADGRCIDCGERFQETVR